jgi:hypothetical protein
MRSNSDRLSKAALTSSPDPSVYPPASVAAKSMSSMALVKTRLSMPRMATCSAQCTSRAFLSRIGAGSCRNSAIRARTVRTRESADALIPDTAASARSAPEGSFTIRADVQAVEARCIELGPLTADRQDLS